MIAKWLSEADSGRVSAAGRAVPAGAGGYASERIAGPRHNHARTGRRACAAKLDAHFALLNVDLAEIVFLHQFHQPADFSNVENVLGRRRSGHGRLSGCYLWVKKITANV